MSEPGVDVAEALGRVLAAHRMMAWGLSDTEAECACGDWATVGTWSDVSVTFNEHIASALAGVVRAERAAALRSAADYLGNGPEMTVLIERESCDWWDKRPVAAWLRDRAAAEATAPHEREAGAAGGGR